MSIMRAQLARELQARGGISGLRHPAAYGGIMGEDGRTAYGWGSFNPFKAAKKVVKAVTKPIKKVASSPLGKAALLGGLGSWGLGMGPLANAPGSGWLGSDFMKRMLLRAPAEGKTLADVAWKMKNVSPFKAATLAATALPFAAPKVDETETFAEEVTNRGKFDFDFAEMRTDIAQAVRGGDYDTFKAVLDKYGLVEGVDVNKWGDLKTGALAKDGGRIGYDMGGGVMMASNIENDKILEALLEKYLDMGLSLPKAEEAAQEEFERMSMRPSNRVMAQEGGIMDLGGMEKDYRNTGGFVEIGGEEKADDVPARLSRNEFVFTADAVRSAGGGDIDKGAEIMENVMKNLEAGGQISEESQGMRGAQEMFDVSERLSEVI